MRNRFIPLILSFSIFSTTLMANTEATHYENWFFQQMHDYELVLTPLIGAVVCGSVAGLPGVAAGIAIGIADECLIYNGYTSEKHLTAGLLGLSLLSTLETPAGILGLFAVPRFLEARFGNELPRSLRMLGSLQAEHFPKILGFALGLSLSSGLIKAETSQIAGPVSAIVAGASYAHARGGLSGFEGAGMGLGAAILDMGLDTANFGGALSAVNTATVLAPVVGYIVSFIPIIHPLGAKIKESGIPERFGIWYYVYSVSPSNSTEDTSNSTHTNTTTDVPNSGIIRSPEQLKEQLDSTFKKLIGTDIVNTLQRKQIVYKLGMSILSSQLNQHLFVHFQDGLQKLGETTAGGLVQQDALDASLKRLSLFLFPYVAKFLGESVILDYQAETLRQIISEAYDHKILHNEAPVHLKSNVEIESDVQKFYDNLMTLAFSGLSVVSGTSDTYTTALHSSLFLFKNEALDVVTFLNSYTTVIEEFMSYCQMEISENQRKLQTLGGNITKYDGDLLGRAPEIVAGRKQELLLKKIKELKKEVREISAHNFKWQQYENVIRNAQWITDMMVSYFLISRKVTFGKFDSKFILPGQQNANTLLQSGNWYLKNKNALTNIKMAMDSVNKVLDHLNTPCDQNSSLETIKKEGPINSILVNYSSLKGPSFRY